MNTLAKKSNRLSLFNAKFFFFRCAVSYKTKFLQNFVNCAPQINWKIHRFVWKNNTKKCQKFTKRPPSHDCIVFKGFSCRHICFVLFAMWSEVRIKHELAFIKHNYESLTIALTLIQKQGVSLTEGLQNFFNIRNQLSVAGNSSVFFI